MPTLPEFTKPAELYYDADASRKYHSGSRMLRIQGEMANRALDLLNVTEDSALILDIGCGSGLSGKILTQRNHQWIGMDISKEMLKIASQESAASGFLCSDMGKPFPFKDDSFDYAISISAVQWLFHSFQTEHIPQKRVREFFRSLYAVIRKAAVIQVYCTDDQMERLKSEADRAGFSGGVVVDAEDTKNCKVFLVLTKTISPSKRNLRNGSRKVSSMGKRPNNKSRRCVTML